jgi:hypothetical protein
MSTLAGKQNMYSAPVPGMEDEQDLFADFENAFPTNDAQEDGDDPWNVASFAKISVVSQQDASLADTTCSTEFPSSLFDSMEKQEDEEEDDEQVKSVAQERTEPPAPMTPDPSFDESEEGKECRDQEAPHSPESCSSEESSEVSSESSSSSESGDENDEEKFGAKESYDDDTPRENQESEELTGAPASPVAGWKECTDKDTPRGTKGIEELTEAPVSAVSEATGDWAKVVGSFSESVKSASEKFVETVKQNIPLEGTAPESKVQDQESVPEVVEVELSDDEPVAKSARSLRSLLSRKSGRSPKSRKSTASSKSAKGTGENEKLIETPVSAVSDSTDVWANVVGAFSENVKIASENVKIASENVKSASEKFVESVKENIPLEGTAPESKVQDQESVPNVVRVESSSSSDDDDESAAKSTRSARSLRSLLSLKSGGSRKSNASRKSGGSRKSNASRKSGGSRKSSASRKSGASKSSNKSQSITASFSPIRAFFGMNNKPTNSSAKSSSVQKPVENESSRKSPNNNDENKGAPVQNITTSTPKEALTKEKQLTKMKSIMKGLGINGHDPDDIVASRSRRETRVYKIVSLYGIFLDFGILDNSLHHFCPDYRQFPDEEENKDWRLPRNVIP